ncbi:MAG TPA: ABC transporter permease subunit [Clostridiales bacterium]|nr:ABC transporter permease subunit [Clostridiales bacterium]
MNSQLELHRTVTTKSKISRHFRTLADQKYLLMMSVPFFIWVIIFRYLPLYGWTMAFQNYKPGKPIFEQEWVGLEHFKILFREQDFYIALRNTLAMSFLGITIGFVTPIVFALLLNEVRNMAFKKTVQTISYLPHFISWVIAASMITQMLSTDGGVVNDILMKVFGLERPVPFMSMPKAFWFIYIAADMWKEVGWYAIIHLAAITGVDQELYEAARVDGCGRLRKIWHVTLPGITPTLIVMLIMNIGWLMSVGFERQFLLGNHIVENYSRTIDLYALNYGISMARYSYGTAIGMFQSVVSIVLVIFANRLAKRIGSGQII